MERKSIAAATFALALSFAQFPATGAEPERSGIVTKACADAFTASFREKQHSTWHFLIENDAFTSYLGARSTDRWYTNGVKVIRTLDVDKPPLWILCGPTGLSRFLQSGGEHNMQVQHGYTFGQLMFTPQSIVNPAPQPLDRYWGGWLYFGTIVQWRPQDSQDQLETLELDYGVVGPGSMVQPTQKAVHQILNVKQPQGWSNQLKTEVGVQANYLRSDRLRHSKARSDDLGYDFTRHVGGTAGTLFSSANAGFSLRLGKGLAGSPVGTIESPALGGMDAPANRWYGLLRLDVKRVFHNTFIDGSIFRADPYANQIVAKDWVAQGTAGFVIEHESGRRLMLLFNRRGAEFNNNIGAKSMQSFVTLGISWDL